MTHLSLRGSALARFITALVVVSLGCWSGGAAYAQEIVDDDGEVNMSGQTIDCNGTGTSVETAIDAAVSAAGIGGEVKICPGTYGPDENISITKNIEITTLGSPVTIQSQSNNGQAEAISISEGSEEITNVEIRNLSIEHSDTGGSPSNATTVLMENGVAGVHLKNLTITRSNLSNTSSAIKPDSTDITIEDSEIAGGPIGFFGHPEGDYVIQNTTIRGGGDEEVWIVNADTLTMKGNTFQTTADGDPSDDSIGVAIYNVNGHIIFEDNTIEASHATVAPLLLGNDLKIKNTMTGTISRLETQSDMRAVLGRNTINGGSPGKVAFVAQSNGMLRGTKGNVSSSLDTVHVVRTSITDATGVGGTNAYGLTALEEAETGDVIHLADGAVYSDRVTLTSMDPDTPGDSADIDLGFAVSGGTATLDTLGIEGSHAVDTPSGTLVIGDSLFTGQGSSVSGTPVELSSGAVLEDKGLVSGTLTATRTVGSAETVHFGNIGLTLTEDGGSSPPGQTTVTRTDGDPVTMGAGSIERYYDVDPANTSGLKVDLTFEYDDGTVGDDELDENGLNQSTLTLFRSGDSGSTWSEVSSISNFDPSSNSIEAADLSSFSRFTAAEEGSALPVELTGLDAHVTGDGVKLTWTTASEQGNAGFDVQRAVKEDGPPGSFQKIGFVEGAGTSTRRHQYRFQDNTVPFGAETLVYRLRQVDRDGSVTLSEPVTVRMQGPRRTSLHGTVANPVQETATIRYDLAKSARVHIGVYNTLGQQVARVVDERKERGRQSVQFDAAVLPSGMYFIRMQTEQVTQTKRMTIVR